MQQRLCTLGWRAAFTKPDDTIWLCNKKYLGYSQKILKQKWMRFFFFFISMWGIQLFMMACRCPSRAQQRPDSSLALPCCDGLRNPPGHVNSFWGTPLSPTVFLTRIRQTLTATDGAYVHVFDSERLSVTLFVYLWHLLSACTKSLLERHYSSALG